MVFKIKTSYFSEIVGTRNDDKLIPETSAKICFNCSGFLLFIENQCKCL